jgi:hypothetical protein
MTQAAQQERRSMVKKINAKKPNQKPGSCVSGKWKMQGTRGGHRWGSLMLSDSQLPQIIASCAFRLY